MHTEEEEETNIKNLIMQSNNTPIKNFARKTKNEEGKEKLITNTPPLGNTINNKEKFKIIDSYINNYYENREKEKEKKIINLNQPNTLKTTNKSQKRNNLLYLRSSSCTNLKIENNPSTRIKASPKMMNKIEISPLHREKEIKEKIPDFNQNNEEANQNNKIKTSLNLERKLSKSSSNNNIKNEHSQIIKDLQENFKDISEEFKLFNRNKNQSISNLKHEKKNTSTIHFEKTKNVKFPDFNKFNTQDVVYELVKHYSNTKISKDEDFMQRMMFDVFKRQTKTERLNKIVEKSKPKIDERQRVETFNRLIKDANRRFDDAEKIETIKKILNEPEPNKKSPEAFEQFAKNYKPPKHWDETYKRLLDFQKEKDESIEKKAIEKEKLKKENEDKIIQEINKKTKKVSKSVIEKSVDRLYSLAEVREIKRQEKLKELEKMNDRYLQELCCLKLETKQKEYDNKEIRGRNLRGGKNNHPSDPAEKKKSVSGLKQNIADKHSKYTTENLSLGYNFENYNRFIYHKNDKNAQIKNHKIIDEKNKFMLENLANKKKPIKKAENLNFKFEFISDSIDEINNELNSNIRNENDKIINTRYNSNDLNQSLNNLINKKDKPAGKKVNLKLQDFLDSDNEEERKRPPLPIESQSNSLITDSVANHNIKQVKPTKNLIESDKRGTLIPQHIVY